MVIEKLIRLIHNVSIVVAQNRVKTLENKIKIQELEDRIRLLEGRRR